jgi:hypothetical protein
VCAAASAILGLAPALALAQPSSSQPLASGYLMVGGGLSRPDSGRMEILALERFGVETDEFSAVYERRNRPVWDISGGVVLASHYMVGIGFTRQTGRAPASMTFTIDYPLPPFPIVASMDSEPLERTETALHIQFGYVFERRGLRVSMFGGPSRINLRGELVSDVDVRFDYYTPAIALEECYHDHVSLDSWGFNAGGDVSYFFSRNVGFGAMARYSRADVLVPNYLLQMMRGRPSSEDVTIGNMHVVAGLRLRF